MFLRLDPYNIQKWYRELLWQPFLNGVDFPILSLFSKIMWRNSKEDVASEVSKSGNFMAATNQECFPSSWVSQSRLSMCTG